MLPRKLGALLAIVIAATVLAVVSLPAPVSASGIGPRPKATPSSDQGGQHGKSGKGQATSTATSTLDTVPVQTATPTPVDVPATQTQVPAVPTPTPASPEHSIPPVTAEVAPASSSSSQSASASSARSASASSSQSEGHAAAPSAAAPGGTQPATPTSSGATETVFVRFKPGTTGWAISAAHSRAGGSIAGAIGPLDVLEIHVPAGRGIAAVASYRSDASVLYAEQDAIATTFDVPNDPYFGTWQWNMAKVSAPQAWDVTQGDPGILIAILDTGLDLTHQDLSPKIQASVNFTTSATSSDVYNHGTHVAAIAAAATDNGLGVAGLGRDSSLLNVKVLGDTGTGSYSWVAKGIIWAADNGAQVINMSLGGPSPSSVLQDAVDYAWSKGVVIVAAAGNSASTDPSYPAAYGNVIAVAATQSSDALSPYSNHGDWVDVAAPGGPIWSAETGNTYGYMAGTSMASPHVAGLAGLVLTIAADSNGSGYRNDEVRSCIQDNADSIGVSGIGSGRINAYRAVLCSTPVAPPAPALATIEGTVTDASIGAGIAGALVTDGTNSVATDSGGAFAFSAVAAGSYVISASAAGYSPSSRSVSVAPGETATADLALDRIPAASISGTVTDASTGDPIAGAQVSNGPQSTLTGPDGSYALDDVAQGDYTVSASATGYISTSIVVSVAQSQAVVANLALGEIASGTITGTVTDASTGDAIAGAEVSSGLLSTVSGDDGSFVLAGFKAGDYTVSASAAGYNPGSITVSVSPGETTVADLPLAPVPYSTITGTVSDAATGVGIPGALVTDGAVTVEAGPDGVYAFQSLPGGAYSISAAAAGFVPNSVALTVAPGEAAVADLALTPLNGGIAGTVTDALTGAAIPGASVSTVSQSTLTGPDGAYVLADVTEGDYVVTASASGYVHDSISVSVAPDETAVADLALAPIDGAIAGTVTDSRTGTFIADALVSTGADSTFTGPDGAYVLPGVVEGDHTVTVSADGYLPGSFEIAVAPGETVLADLTLNAIAPGMISGTVTDTLTGAAIEGARVTGGLQSILTGPDGEYALPGLAEGDYNVSASADGYHTGSVTVSVTSGQTAAADMSLVPEDGTVAGTVTDASTGAAIAGAQVSGSGKSTVTGGDGSFILTGITEGDYTVTASASGYAPGAATATVPPGGTASADLALAPLNGTITGLVTDSASGAAVVGATISDGTRSAVTDGNGRYYLTEVPQGDYTVLGTAIGYAQSSAAVHVAPGARVNVSLTLTSTSAGVVRGFVVSAVDGSPVSGATVTIAAITTSTDSSGGFSISGLARGVYTVTASAANFRPASASVAVAPGQTSVADFSLARSMWIQDLSFGKKGRNLSVTIQVATDGGSVVSGAAVSFDLSCSDGSDWYFSGTTDSNGMATFTLSKPPDGTYGARITALTAGGFLWNAALGVTSATDTFTSGHGGGGGNGNGNGKH